MLANPGVAMTWWDQAAWAERLGYAQQDASLSAAVFRALRESNLRLLERRRRPQPVCPWQDLVRPGRSGGAERRPAPWPKLPPRLLRISAAKVSCDCISSR